MTRSLLILTIALLGGCNKYGPEQEAKQSPTADPGSATAQNEKADLLPLVASSYTMPNADYTLWCDLNSVAGVGLDPRVPGSIENADKVVFNGWIVDARQKVPSEFLIVLKGDATYAIKGTAGLERPDVANSVGAPSALMSGYGFVADISSIAAGRYSVHLLVPEQGEACDTTKILDITQGPSSAP